jgi:hypothetical protein
VDGFQDIRQHERALHRHVVELDTRPLLKDVPARLHDFGEQRDGRLQRYNGLPG